MNLTILQKKSLHSSSYHGIAPQSTLACERHSNQPWIQDFSDSSKLPCKYLEVKKNTQFLIRKLKWKFWDSWFQTDRRLMLAIVNETRIEGVGTYWMLMIQMTRSSLGEQGAWKRRNRDMITFSSLIWVEDETSPDYGQLIHERSAGYWPGVLP